MGIELPLYGDTEIARKHSSPANHGVQGRVPSFKVEANFDE
jgi:hypothetical protein